MNQIIWMPSESDSFEFLKMAWNTVTISSNAIA